MKFIRGKQMNTLSILTLLSTFLMGFIDAYTFSEHSGTFASAQTGNIISFSVKLSNGMWSDAAGHIFVLLGFAIGAYIAEAIIQQLKVTGIHRFQIFILLQTILLLFLALFQKGMADEWIVFCLGLLAGYELTVFRNVRNSTVNNGIMTGNTKNLMNNLYLAIHKKDRAAKEKAIHLMITILLFITGVGIGILLANINGNLNLWLAFGLNMMIWLWLKIKQLKRA